MLTKYIPYLAAIAFVILGATLLVDKFILAKRRDDQRASTGVACNPPRLVEIARSYFPLLSIVLVIESFVVQPFQIPSGSMEPTLEVGDFILVNKLAYGVRLPLIHKKIAPVFEPKRGDVMVFRYPSDPSVDYIKRVVGVPGDRILYTRDKKLFVNGYLIAHELVGKDAQGETYREQLGAVEHMIRLQMSRYHAAPSSEWTVPAGHYFMMGDNRDGSYDSRYWTDPNIPAEFLGMVPEDNIVGKAFAIVMSWPEPRLSNFPNIWRSGWIH